MGIEDVEPRPYGAYYPYQVETTDRYGSLPRAPHIGHKQHLCDLAERGELTLDQIKALVKDPKFICRKCGRVANKAENLCEPVPL